MRRTAASAWEIAGEPAPWAKCGATDSLRLANPVGLMSTPKNWPVAGPCCKKRNINSVKLTKNNRLQAIEGATRFSDERDFSTIDLIKEFKQQRWIFDELEQVTTVSKREGRNRLEGSWALAYLAFIAVGEVDVEPWYCETHPDLWDACGFAERPSYSTVYARFCELEDKKYEAAFVAAVSKIVRSANKHLDGLIGQRLYIDGTESSTHAPFEHICPEGHCPFEERERKREEKLEAKRRKQRAAKGESEPAVESAGTDDSTKEDKPETTEPATKKKSKRRRGATIMTPEEARAERQRLDEMAVSQISEVTIEFTEEGIDEDGYRVVKLGTGCIYRTRDHSAGLRVYTSPDGSVAKIWGGGNVQQVIDYATGVPIASLVVAASVQEYNAYPAAYAKAVSITGFDPKSMSADRGYAVSSVYHHNAARGVASVMPFRKHGANDEPKHHETDEIDRHGVPRCAGCGGATFFHRGPTTQENRVWCRCMAPQFPSCDGIQSRPVKPKHDADYHRFFQPIFQTEELWWALVAHGKALERVHHHYRERYRVGGNTVSTRPKRLGVACQQLRASAANLITWFRMARKRGWLVKASVRKAITELTLLRAEEQLKGLLAERELLGLDNPYGAVAVARKCGGLKAGQLYGAAGGAAGGGKSSGSGSPPGNSPPTT
jgi:hypothetical protein